MITADRQELESRLKQATLQIREKEVRAARAGLRRTTLRARATARD